MTFARILALLGTTGIGAAEGQAFADAAAALPLLAEFPHAIVLMDVAAERVTPRPPRDASSLPHEHRPRASEGLRLARLRGALILNTGGDNRDVLARIDRLVGRYTHNEAAQLTRQRVGDDEFVRLRDNRLPDWAVFEWGRLDDCYAVTIGEGAFDAVAAAHRGRAPSLAADRWFRAAHRKTLGKRAVAEWLIDFVRLESRLGGAARPRYRAVIDALDAAGIQRDLWTVGVEGRALTCRRLTRRDGRDTLHAYSEPSPDAARPTPNATKRLSESSLVGPEIVGPASRRSGPNIVGPASRRSGPVAQTGSMPAPDVPPAARHYAVLRVPARWLFDNLPRAFVAAWYVARADVIADYWEKVQRDLGIDARLQLLENVQPRIIACDFPPHPLRVPLAVTIAFAIDEPRQVRKVVDALLGEWSRRLEARSPDDWSAVVRLHVRRDPDGVWYLQAGLLGPAVTVTDRYLVLSWSPQALREALPTFR